MISASTSTRKVGHWALRGLFVLCSLFGLYLFGSWILLGLADGTVPLVEAMAMVVSVAIASYLWMLIDGRADWFELGRRQGRVLIGILSVGLAAVTVMWLVGSSFRG